MSPPKILVVEDDHRIAASVRRALVYDGLEVEVVHDGMAALSAIRTQEPDLVVLDLMLPGVDGIEVCRRIRAAGDPVSILMLTARDTIEDRVKGLDVGADDYLIKPFAYEELLARVRSLLRRRPAAIAAARLGFADLTLDPEKHEVNRDHRVVDLTALEFRFLEYFLRNPRIVLSRVQVLEAVWGLDAETTSNVVDVYVGYLRQKLEAGGESRLLHTVRGVGYVLKEA